VTNEGEGIAPEEQELIFEKFHRAPTAVQQAIPGTGLGLALVKPLVKHLRGKVTVVSAPKAESTIESGTNKPQAWVTCFTVKLPQFLDGGTV
jgi:signal transduction histidine kinase